MLATPADRFDALRGGEFFERASQEFCDPSTAAITNIMRSDDGPAEPDK